MTHTNLTPAFDGTAALDTRSGVTRLVLIDGGRKDRRESTPASRGLSFAQSAVFLAVGVILVGALCATSLLVDTFVATSREASLSDLPEMELVVGEGDSLWTIASSLGVEGVSTADVVSWISTHNDLADSTLSVGQRLIVPRAVTA